MDEEARATVGLDLDPDQESRKRSWDSRRSPYGIADRGPSDSQGAPHGVHPGAGRTRETYAALDLGTNNCRLLVARPTGNAFRVVDAFSRIVRLGEGVSATGRLSEPAMVRAIEALKICRDKMRNRDVTRARLIATEACRTAANGAEFRERVLQEAELSLEIVDRETEACLAATGCTPLVDPLVDAVILFDIGGGSSELVRLGRGQPCRQGPPAPKILSWDSLPVGVVTLAERHGGHTVTRAVYDAMVAEVTAYLQAFTAANKLCETETFHMLGTSGTVTTIAGVHLDLARYDRRRVDGCWLSDGEVTAVVDRLLGMSFEERVANPCIGAERADLVLAGCAILDAIRNAFPCARMRVADRGLREGMLVQMMREDGVWSSSVVGTS